MSTYEAVNDRLDRKAREAAALQGMIDHCRGRMAVAIAEDDAGMAAWYGRRMADLERQWDDVSESMRRLRLVHTPRVAQINRMYGGVA